MATHATAKRLAYDPANPAQRAAMRRRAAGKPSWPAETRALIPTVEETDDAKRTKEFAAAARKVVWVVDELYAAGRLTRAQFDLAERLWSAIEAGDEQGHSCMNFMPSGGGAGGAEGRLIGGALRRQWALSVFQDCQAVMSPKFFAVLWYCFVSGDGMAHKPSAAIVRAVHGLPFAPLVYALSIGMDTAANALAPNKARPALALTIG